jgi:hypothetical protein
LCRAFHLRNQRRLHCRAVAAPTPVPLMPDVDTWVVTSAGSHSTYQIWVARPDGYSKQHARYPVLYVGDANTLFGIAVEAAALLAISKQIPAVVVVGIGYPKPGPGFRATWVGGQYTQEPSGQGVPVYGR